jgi:dTDP-4-amino-4,6-dideoxygalactose transaminase
VSIPSPRLKLATKPGFYRMALAQALGLHGDAGSSIERAEQSIAGYVKARHAICTSMGRMAIYDGLRALLPEGGEILLSPVTVPEVVSMVLLAGSKPVFCDIAPGTWNVDPKLLEARIGPDTRAIMTTHFYGNISASEEVRRICDRHGLRMIEDAAQAIGAWKDGRHAGTVGDFGILSFSYPKGVTSFFGGALITDDDALAERVRGQMVEYPAVDRAWLYRRIAECLLKDAATSPLLFPLSFGMIRYAEKNDVAWLKRQVEQELNPRRLDALPPEYSARLSPLQARLLTQKWGEIDDDVAHRIACAETYHEALGDLDEVRLAPLATDRSHTYLYYPIDVGDKFALQHFMIERGRDVAVQHTPNCADLSAYREFGSECPHARSACAGTLMLPTYPGYPLDEVRANSDVIREYFRHG